MFTFHVVLSELDRPTGGDSGAPSGF
jgi:hypothetical protein